MNTTAVTPEDFTFSSEELQAAADMIKAAGLKVFIKHWGHTQAKPSYFHFTDGEKIGYCQANYFGGVTFSTVHKPSKNVGTGFGLQEYMQGIFNPTIEDAKQAFIFAPNWAKPYDREKVVKFKSWEEYTNTPMNSCKYSEY